MTHISVLCNTQGFCIQYYRSVHATGEGRPLSTVHAPTPFLERRIMVHTQQRQPPCGPKEVCHVPTPFPERRILVHTQQQQPPCGPKEVCHAPTPFRRDTFWCTCNSSSPLVAPRRCVMCPPPHLEKHSSLDDQGSWRAKPCYSLPATRYSLSATCYSLSATH